MSMLISNEGKVPSNLSFHWNTFATTQAKIEDLVGKSNHTISGARNAWSLILIDDSGNEHKFFLYDDFGEDSYKKKEIVVWLIASVDENDGNFIYNELDKIL